MRAGPDGSFEVPDPDEWATSVVIFRPERAAPSARPARHPGSRPVLRDEGQGHVWKARSPKAAVPSPTRWSGRRLAARTVHDQDIGVPARRSSGWTPASAARRRWWARGRRPRDGVVVAVQPVRPAGGNGPRRGRQAAGGRGDGGRVGRAPRRGRLRHHGRARAVHALDTLPSGRYWPYAMRSGYATGSQKVRQPLDLRTAPVATHDFVLTPSAASPAACTERRGPAVRGRAADGRLQRDGGITTATRARCWAPSAAPACSTAPGRRRLRAAHPRLLPGGHRDHSIP